MRDGRISRKVQQRFPQLIADSKIVCGPLTVSKKKIIASNIPLRLLLPESQPRTRWLSNQFLILEPSFTVCLDDLYELPLCYLPRGTMAEFDAVPGVDSYKSKYSVRIAKCASEREARDAEPNRIKALRAAGEVEEANKLEAQLKARIARQRKEEGKQDHEELIRRVSTALKDIKNIVNDSATVLADGYSTQDSDHVASTIAWLESYLLMCVAMVRLQTKGPIPRPDPEVGSISIEQRSRSTLANAMDDALTKSCKSPAPCPDNTLLRRAIGPEAKACNPFSNLTHLATWPTWEEFLPREARDNEKATSSRSSHSDSASDSTGYVTASEEPPKEKLGDSEDAAKFIGPVRPPTLLNQAQQHE